MGNISPEQWCAERSAMEPEKTLDKLLVQTYWVRLMKTVVPVPELDSMLGVRPSEAFLYCGPVGTGKHTLAMALAGTLKSQGYRYYQIAGWDLNEDMELRLETILRQVDPEHPALLQFENLHRCENADALAACLAQMIALCRQAKLPVFFIVIGQEEELPAMLLRELMVCRFTLPDLEERSRFYGSALSKSFPLQMGLDATDLASASEGLDWQQLALSLQLMVRGLKEQAINRYKSRYSLAQDAMRSRELAVDLPMFREIVAKLKRPEKEAPAPIQIVQSVAAPAAATIPGVPEQPESKTDKLKQSKNMADFFKNL